MTNEAEPIAPEVEPVAPEAAPEVELVAAEPPSEVHRVYAELRAVGELLSQHGSMSDLVSFNELSAKTMVLSAASYFESAITSAILDVAKETGSAVTFREFKYNQGLHRKYHTLFNWKTDTATSFFALFGASAKEWFNQQVKDDDGLKEGIREFMFLGRRRNEIVHGNFASIAAEVTFEDAFKKYEKAMTFVSWLPAALKRVTQQLMESEAVGG